MIEAIISFTLFIVAPIYLIVWLCKKSKTISDFEAAQRMAGVYVEPSKRRSFSKLWRFSSWRCKT